MHVHILKKPSKINYELIIWDKSRNSPLEAELTSLAHSWILELSCFVYYIMLPVWQWSCPSIPYL